VRVGGSRRGVAGRARVAVGVRRIGDVPHRDRRLVDPGDEVLLPRLSRVVCSEASTRGKKVSSLASKLKAPS
jgi:hypothetical protein